MSMNTQYSLVELIRLLEQRNHIFTADPLAITDLLRQTDGEAVQKLYRRAEMIDRDHHLRHQLQRHQRRVHMIYQIALLVWFVVGFMGTYGLMKQAALNFFFILVGILGMNTLMMLWWLVSLFKRSPMSQFSPWGWDSKDSVQQALLELHTVFRPYAMWRKHVLTHQLALSGLMGMFVAALLLLLVRQYSFNWESTLLSNQHFAYAVMTLAWLPEKLGFVVPDATAILAGRNHHDTANAAAWGSLLLGSMVCYGMLPRVLAWVWSVWQVRQNPPELNMMLPYYQNIIHKWQRKIVDSADDYVADAVSPPIDLQQHAAHWAVAVDIEPTQAEWHLGVLGHDWVVMGVVASREEWADLTARLVGQGAQLLVAIRATQTPDRGMIRRLGAWAQHANLVIWLWDDGTLQPERLAQWHDVLQQHGWGWLNPDKWVQQQRLA